MATVNAVQDKVTSMIGSVGKAALSALFPNDFEVYMCTLELATSNGDTIDSFTFPVMPSNMSRTESKRSTIKQTAGGIISYSSPIFSPIDISINGNFGRKFKILLGDTDVAGVAFSTMAGKYDLASVSQSKKSKPMGLSIPSLDAGVKNGYGCIKILNAIISKSNGVDRDGNPFRLYFYNMAMGESYLVVIPSNGFSLKQSMATNMIWEYTLSMTAIAPMDSVKNQTKGASLVKKLVASQIQKSINDLASLVSTTIK